MVLELIASENFVQGGDRLPGLGADEQVLEGTGPPLLRRQRGGGQDRSCARARSGGLRPVPTSGASTCSPTAAPLPTSRCTGVAEAARPHHGPGPAQRPLDGLPTRPRHAQGGHIGVLDRCRTGTPRRASSTSSPRLAALFKRHVVCGGSATCAIGTTPPLKIADDKWSPFMMDMAHIGLVAARAASLSTCATS